MPTEAELDELMTRPSPGLIADLSTVDGDLVVLGAGGKMGPSLVRLARRAVVDGGLDKRVIAVSRFGSGELAERLAADGVEIVRADLTDEASLAGLPDAGAVVYLVGAKFGSHGNESFTWMVNSYLPGRIAQRYAGARIAAFSTGNVYPLTPVTAGGADERTPPGPVGEYAMSCLGRERVLEHFGSANGTPIALLRLNYAIDLRYGVLVDIARRVRDGEEIDLTTGNVNVVWQGWANEVALRSLRLAGTPAVRINIAGPETVSVRKLAEAFAARFGVSARLTGEEAPTALLSDGGAAHALFGYPSVGLHQLIDWTADWVRSGGTLLDKPTKFERRDGRF
ncbi:MULTISPECIES: NAD-dependent epimerase/dehydratase family protein [Amycolatopsis]|uniref:NAD(P)-dependent oxidoreductase n=1 Tax=Amycolatopsis dongchuanensis TaxID=1070866 RepID=A0ABP9PTR9_9PSEU